MEEQGTAQSNESHPTTQGPVSHPPLHYQPPQCYPPPLYNSSYCPDPYSAQWPQAETYPAEEKDTDVRNINHPSTQTPLPYVPSQYCPPPPPPPPQDCTYSHRPYYQHWQSGHPHPCFHHPHFSCHCFCHFPSQNPCIPYHPHYSYPSQYHFPTPCCPPSGHPSQAHLQPPHSFHYPSSQGPHPVCYSNSGAFVDHGGVEPKKVVDGKVDAHIGSTSIPAGEETLASTSAGHYYPSHGPHPSQFPGLHSSPLEPPPPLLNLATFIQQHFAAAQDAIKGQTDAKSVSSSAAQAAENVISTSALLQSEAHLSNLQDPQEQAASYPDYKYSNTQNPYGYLYPTPLQLPHPQSYGPPSWGPHPPCLPGPSYAPWHCQLHAAWNQHYSQPPVSPPPPPPELYPGAKYPYTQYFKDLIQRFSSQALNPHPSNEVAVNDTVDDSEQGREEIQPEEHQTWERGNILEGLMDDDEEDEDGEEPQYAMTDEWAKFFATSEARRREKRRQQKRQAKAARKAARALELEPASCDHTADIDDVVHGLESNLLEEKDVQGEVEEGISGFDILSVLAEPAQESLQASSQPHEE